MKIIYTFLLAASVTAGLFAQSPEKMSYQSVIRNNSDELIISTTVGIQISILQGSSGGPSVYVETHTPTSNANGLISIEVGDGTLVSGIFANIDWSDGPYFIKTETDPTGGTNYTITGTSQLLSVPYALHSKNAENLTGTIIESDPVFTVSPANGITFPDISIWNTAYNWGNHASAGYLTGFTEIDPKIGINTSGFSPKWDGTAMVTGVIFQDASGKVGIGTIPNASAKVEVSSNSGGLLIPRMSTEERNNIASPATSLLIYNITTDCLEMYSANGLWVNIGCGCQLPGSFSSSAASNISGTSFSANWATSPGANSYFLDISTSNDFSSFAGIYNYNVGNVTTFNVTGLSCNTTYYYRLRANNSCGSTANSNTVTVTSGATVFNYTGGVQAWIVPAGVTSITIDASGASGGTGYNYYGPGGNGARVQTTIAVTPSETLYLYVGGSGGNGSVGTGAAGYNGGGAGGIGNGDGWVGSGGGGSSDIRRGGTELTNRVVVAGGGGGDSYNTNGGAGGYIGINANGGGIGGNGGTQSAGGAAGYSGCCSGELFSGGAGTYHIGGGGGGGFYGGGGGGSTGGGGGGSSTSQGTSTTYTDGYQNGNGQIIISCCPSI
jgi:hypothetical protein